MKESYESFEILSPPETMENLPTLKELKQLKQGDLVKLMFQGIENHEIERMWVMVQIIDGNRVYGTLDNHPFSIKGLHAGEVIFFTLDKIMTID